MENKYVDISHLFSYFFTLSLSFHTFLTLFLFPTLQSPVAFSSLYFNPILSNPSNPFRFFPSFPFAPIPSIFPHPFHFSPSTSLNPFHFLISLSLPYIHSTSLYPFQFLVSLPLPYIPSIFSQSFLSLSLVTSLNFYHNQYIYLGFGCHNW